MEHSISPLLHASVFSRLGVNAEYEKLHVTPEALADFVLSMRGETAVSGGFDAGCGGGNRTSAKTLLGINVTLPHKIAVLPLLDEARGDALDAGSVNTVVREGGRLIGYNTDMEGLLRAIRSRGYDYTGSVVCIFGTGGAALGAAVKAARSGAGEVRIVGRNAERAELIAERARAADSGVRVAAFAEDSLADEVSGADIFINATPLGMKGFGADFERLTFLDALPARALVFDCVYTPSVTALARAAAARGLVFETGLSMLVWQGLISDTYFTRAAALDIDAGEILSEDIFKSVYNILEKELNDVK